MDKLRGLLDIGRIDRVLNPLNSKLCIVVEGVYKRIDKSILQWFGHIERMGNDRIYVWECL